MLTDHPRTFYCFQQNTDGEIPTASSELFHVPFSRFDIQRRHIQAKTGHNLLVSTGLLPTNRRDYNVTTYNVKLATPLPYQLAQLRC